MRRYAAWAAPLPDGGVSQENALVFDQGRDARLLVIPPLFDEANKLRRQIVEVMRRLNLAGIDSFLPDWPGMNESLQPLENQTLANWRKESRVVLAHFGASHVLTLRAGALLAPPQSVGWRYAPIGGETCLRAMIRARAIASKEAGAPETLDAIEDAGRSGGITLAGWTIGKALFCELGEAPCPENDDLTDIAQATIGGPGLWLRAEPAEDPVQADALAAILAMGMLEP